MEGDHRRPAPLTLSVSRAVSSLTFKCSVIARVVLVVVLLVTAGCGARTPPRFAADAAAYEVRDTAEYESMLSGGEYGLLVRDGVVIDSVDLFFGLNRLNNGAVVFLPVEPVEAEELPGAMEVTEHVVFDGRRRVPLHTFLPHFSDYFSSPSVIEGILYYWGLEARGDGEYRLHALRYDARRRRVRSCFLVQTEVATDNRGHFAPPAATDRGVRFETYGYDFVVDREFIAREGTAAVRPCLTDG